ncbi:unnamed protein product [Polarella glacialis]|uniref:Uncharacterized protein n=1 Tax=Polarella glacialis TaxID=89957 RepID=A0A813FY41_POLGL|nr:unnamed protein product [Polarella glacialis]
MNKHFSNSASLGSGGVDETGARVNSAALDNLSLQCLIWLTDLASGFNSQIPDLFPPELAPVNLKMLLSGVALMKDKDSNEKEIKERDKTIADKEQRIKDLKKQNQELAKFRFVLDYKIKELKAQIDPKTADIASMKTQTQAMDDELSDYMRKNKQLALDISQLQMKQRALQEEIKSQKRRLREDLSLIKRFKLDLSDCMETISEPKALKESVTALYRKYVQAGAKRLDLDTDMQKEEQEEEDKRWDERGQSKKKARQLLKEWKEEKRREHDEREVRGEDSTGQDQTTIGEESRREKRSMSTNNRGSKAEYATISKAGVCVTCA